jgi:uncharacterized protein (DUF433 family)
MSLLPTDRIEVNPAVMLGRPVIRGTRIPVELITRKLGEGATEADLLDAYPRLTRADIRHCCATGRLRWLMPPTRWPTKPSYYKRPDGET